MEDNQGRINLELEETAGQRLGHPRTKQADEVLGPEALAQLEKAIAVAELRRLVRDLRSGCLGRASFATKAGRLAAEITAPGFADEIVDYAQRVTEDVW